jgi:phosphatidylethanolamine-binding protein (PEBP) family uncharacterized protein
MRSAGGLSEAGMRLTSPAFEDGEAIPPDRTCTGRDRSPALAWAERPASTRSLALLVDDPDAPRGTHWLAWGIDPVAGGRAEGERPPREGRNDFGTVGYRGPCPPRGTDPTVSAFACTPSMRSSTPGRRHPRPARKAPARRGARSRRGQSLALR